MDRDTRRGLRLLRLPRWRLGGVLAVALAAAFIIWLVVRNDGGSSTPTSTVATRSTKRATLPAVGPVAVTEKGLRRLVTSLGQPVYWAGLEPGRRFGLTRTSKGEIFLRYLPPGARANERKRFLTIGTYPFRGAFAATQALARKPGAVSSRLDGGGLAYYRRDHPVSVYLVYPDLDYQIEVYSPAPARAYGLVVAGRIRPIR